MRLQILSDLHLELDPIDRIQSPLADVIILAGDIDAGTKGIKWALKSFSKPVIYVPGNHEFYERVRSELLKELRSLAQGTHVRLLDMESAKIGDVEFFGATLWTDFNYYETPEMDMKFAQRNVVDFHIIEEEKDRPFTPTDAVNVHRQAMDWLLCALSQSTAPKRVVITHHAPSANSVASRYAGHPLNPFFVSRLEPLLQSNSIDLWIHGHTHTSFHYSIGSTTVVCNPRGYIPYEENENFDPHKLIVL